jgi:hypothetical protein
MIHKFLFDNEPLELDLSKQINNSSSKLNSLIRAIVVKIFRKSYKFFQQSFLRPSIRQKLSFLEKLIFRKDHKINNFHNLGTVKKNVTELKSSSFVKIDNIFSDNEILKIRTQFSSNNIKLDPIYGKYEKFRITDKVINAHTGYIPTEKIFNNTNIIKGALNQNLLNTLKLHFNSSFKLDWIWSWWSIPNEKSLGPQLFHRDYESMNFVKFFVYLTDVNENNGPHQIISGSHNENNFYKRERFKDYDINKKYKKKINTIYGNAGTNFLADTFAIHRGQLPRINKRLVLVYLFSVVPSNRCPKLPFMNVNKITDKKISKEMKKNQSIFDQIYSF